MTWLGPSFIGSTGVLTVQRGSCCGGAEVATLECSRVGDLVVLAVATVTGLVP